MFDILAVIAALAFRVTTPHGSGFRIHKRVFDSCTSLPSSFRDAPLGAGPESITTIVSMDSGLAPRGRAPE